MAIEREPRRKAPWPPGGTAYKVRDGDDWYRVAQKHNIPVKDLIRFNFDTTDPPEVNWYLRHYVGCKKQTADRNNWVFTSSASPGRIYIPTSVAGTAKTHDGYMQFGVIIKTNTVKWMFGLIGTGVVSGHVFLKIASPETNGTQVYRWRIVSSLPGIAGSDAFGWLKQRAQKKLNKKKTKRKKKTKIDSDNYRSYWSHPFCYDSSAFDPVKNLTSLKTIRLLDLMIAKNVCRLVWKFGCYQIQGEDYRDDQMSHCYRNEQCTPACKTLRGKERDLDIFMPLAEEIAADPFCSIVTLSGFQKMT